MSNNPRVLRMNEQSSQRYADVPLPVRQQLGDFTDLVDVDARSGNGIRDYDLRVDAPGRDFQELDPEHNGHKVLDVRYHLDSTPPPSEPAGAPGSKGYNQSQARLNLPGQDESDLTYSTQGNATLAVQKGEKFISTQREIPGRNERYAAAVGLEDSASAEAGSGKAAVTLTSGTVRDSGDEVPTGTIASVKSWVGTDKERAQQALEAEQQRETPRNTLVEWLQDRLEDNNEE
jgi:hypothetical protein